MKIGILALQGGFVKHQAMMQSLGVEILLIREPEELNQCDGLILPGGESTTMQKLLDRNHFFPLLHTFALEKPLFGTCAGLILMATSLKLFDITMERNGYGRQIDSYTTQTTLYFNRKRPIPFPALFIRAPRITSCSSSVDILASTHNEPILIQQGHHIGATFHPELTTEPAIHNYFLSIVKNPFFPIGSKPGL